MSNFQGHATAGLFGAGMIGAGLSAKGYPAQTALGGAIFVFLFSIFPDIDVKSVPSKIFYTAIFITLLMLFYTEQHKLAHIIALVAIIPQLTSHRGIMHSKITSVVVPLAVVALAPMGMTPLQNSWLLGFCGVLGYNIHLGLDGLWFK